MNRHFYKRKENSLLIFGNSVPFFVPVVSERVNPRWFLRVEELKNVVAK